MEATVLSVGKSVVSGALNYAQSAVAKEVALQLGVQSDQAFIRDELEMMQSFLMAAQDERDDNKVIQTWVKQVRDLGYDVEDCLQDFAVHLEKPPCWWHILRTLLERRHVAVQMKSLRAKVEDVSQRNLRYHLIRGPTVGSKPVAATAEQHSAGSKASATMFAVDKAKHAMKPRVDLTQLINKEQGKDLIVIAVWGTCGVLGQASVIRQAYDDSDNFECCAWIKLTHPFDPIVFMQSIMRQFYGYSSFPELASEVRGCRERASTIGAEVLKKMLIMKQEDLVDEFKEHVNNKSYLIVLNDLCSIEDWDWIRTYFPVNSNGNRIIVATQQVEVASLCVGRYCQVSELKQLSADQTLYVFYHKGPQGGINSMKPEPSSNTLSTSCEIASDQAKDGADWKNTDRGSLTRMMTITAALEGSQVVGRETEKSHILRLIIDPARHSTERQVISVWGMGGMGKTALVKDIYQSQELAGVFEKRACVTVMSLSKEDLLRSLVMQLLAAEVPEENVTISLLGSSAKTPLSWSIQKLENETEIILKGKRCLIFFDDLSSTADWDMICASLPQMENASRIIVTTRAENIANYCSKKQENVCKLEILNKEHALGLFTKKVFRENECLHQQYPELVEQAEQILKKCNGLPLPIVAIGGFLANQPKTATEWRKLNENLSSELEIQSLTP